MRAAQNLGRFTGNLTSDPNGTYTYNGAQQMTSAIVGADTFDYKYAGTSQVEVLKQQIPFNDLKVVYGRTDQHGNPVIEQTQFSTLTAYVENDPVTGQPLLLRTSTGGVSLYVYSGTGSPIANLSENGGTSGTTNTYDPYGLPDITSCSGCDIEFLQNPFMFQGGIRDIATGFYKFGNRWYDPTTGRWTQQDTLDAPLDPANANRYAYAGCDPINNTDPTGLLSCSGTIGLVGLVHSLMWSALWGAALGGGVGLAAGFVYGLGWWAVAEFGCE